MIYSNLNHQFFLLGCGLPGLFLFLDKNGLLLLSQIPCNIFKAILILRATIKGIQIEPLNFKQISGYNIMLLIRLLLGFLILAFLASSFSNWYPFPKNLSNWLPCLNFYFKRICTACHNGSSYLNILSSLTNWIF